MHRQLTRPDSDLATLDVGAIAELQAAGVEPHVWKIEGLDAREDCERVVAQARAMIAQRYRPLIDVYAEAALQSWLSGSSRSPAARLART
jgi:hypothetical protein